MSYPNDDLGSAMDHLYRRASMGRRLQVRPETQEILDQANAAASRVWRPIYLARKARHDARLAFVDDRTSNSVDS